MSPSSVEKEPKATRSGNARIHGMTQVTAASIAYIATQVRIYFSTSYGLFDTEFQLATALVLPDLISCVFEDRYCD